LARSLLIPSLVLTYLTAELMLGVVPWSHFRVRTPDGPPSVGLDCYPTNPRNYFDLDLRDLVVRKRFEALGLPGVDALVSQAPHCVELRYNSLGLRDRTPAPRRPNVRRVIVVGDPFAEGQGVKEEDVYPRLLEEELNARGAERWEVLNFGRSGADFPELEDSFEQLLSFDPDVVVYGMMLNDCELSASFRAQHPLLSERLRGVGRADAPASLQPFGLRTVSFVPQQWEMFRVNWGTAPWYRELYGEPNLEGWRRTQAQIQRMQRRLLERGGRFLVALWPVLNSLAGGYPLRRVHETVGEFCQQAGIAWLDLLPVLEGHSSVALWVHPVDTHPNERAHRLVADELALAVQRLVKDGPG
jgi:lysophospholipase L1-like esterase